MDFKKILTKLRKVIVVLFALGFDKHLDYDQESDMEEDSHEDEEK